MKSREFSFASAVATKSTDRYVDVSEFFCVPEFPNFAPRVENVKNVECFSCKLVIENFSWILWGICWGNGKCFLHRGKSGGDGRNAERMLEKSLKSKFNFFRSQTLFPEKRRVLERFRSPSFWPSVISITIFYSYFASLTININYP